MKSLLENQWIFSSSDSLAIQFFHKDMFVWIAVDKETNEIKVVGVQRLYREDKYGVCYVAQAYPDEGILGECRTITIIGDDIKTGEPRTFTWVGLTDKQLMLDDLRKALSYRKYPLPLEFKEIWKQAIEFITNMDIVNAGRPRYIG